MPGNVLEKANCWRRAYHGFLVLLAVLSSWSRSWQMMEDFSIFKPQLITRNSHPKMLVTGHANTIVSVLFSSKI